VHGELALEEVDHVCDLVAEFVRDT
jgi:hypothetical protein